MKRIAAALLVVAAASPAASAGGGCIDVGVPSAEVAGSTVGVRHACFAPAALVVAPGTTVTFRNDSGLAHNLSGPGILMADLSDGVRHPVTFTRAGLYPFQCTLHPGMAGVVVVRDAAAAAPAVDVPADAAAATAPAGRGGGSVVPWAAAGGVVLLAAVAAFVRRTRGVPLPAR